MSNKGELRRQFRARFEAKANSAVASYHISRSLCDWFAASASQMKALDWAGYQALSDEPDLTAAYAELSSRGVRWFFPVVDGPDLRFFHVENESWCAGPWGLREPDPAQCREAQLGELEGVLVPGVAFDRSGYRLGRGKGFYDRALQNFNGFKIGLAFDWQLSSDDLPVEPHDVRMDVVVTESHVFQPQKGQQHD